MIEDHLDIEQRSIRDDAMQELRQHFAHIFQKLDPEQSYAVDAIHRAFAAIGKTVPPVVMQAHNLINRKPKTPVERADIMEEMLGVSEQLGVLYAEWDRFLDKLKLALYPPVLFTHEDGTTEKLTDATRKLRLEAKIAKFVAVRDILFYLLSHCAKYGPSTHQSILNLERDLLRNSV